MSSLAVRLSALCAVLLAGCAHPPVSALASAARRGDTGAIRAFVNDGDDPNAASGVNEWPPIMHAIHKNQAAAAFALIEAGANVNVAGRDGLTPLMMAAGYGQTGIVRGLLDRGANPRLRNRHGMTALDLAISGVPDIDAFTLGGCQTETVHVLLDRAPGVRPAHSLLARAASVLRQCDAVDRLLSAKAR